MECECSHMSWHHSRVTYPAYREPCEKCLNCDRQMPGPGRECCDRRVPCPCSDFRTAEKAGVA